jgi:putative intracellular protease/amidase
MTTDQAKQGTEHHMQVDLVSSTPKRVLLVVGNPTTSPTLGWPVGFWAAEATHPYYELTERGVELTIASPEGGAVTFDAYSDPRDDSGWSAEDLITMGFVNTPECMALLADTPKLAALDWASFDALMVAGGQSAMFTFRDNADLKRAIVSFYEAEKPVAAYCHGTAALVDVMLADGSYLVAGKTVTGFANVEEDYGDAVVGQRIMPWRVEDALRERGANYVHGGLFKAFVVRDGRLITGQQQYSSRKVAQAVIEAMGV